MAQGQQNPNLRFVGKVKNQQANGTTFQKIVVDNPSPQNPDGTPNTYHKGSLLWCDAATGKKFLVKQMSFKGVSQNMLQKGFSNSIAIDLGNEYDVQNLG